MSTLTLYQFELCPYCHKVKAGLELKGIPYRKVEVNPMNKRELKDLGPSPDGRKKVPVIEFKGDVVRESSDILRWLDDAHPNTPPLLAEDAGSRSLAEEIDAWVNDDLTQVLPTVLYGTWGESVKAARLTAKTSNFSRADNIKVSLFGSVIMKIIAKRILKRRGEGQSGEQLLARELDRLEGWLGEKPYLCGEAITLADASAHGALTCVKEFPAFRFIEARPRLKQWYQRVAAQRHSPHSQELD